MVLTFTVEENPSKFVDTKIHRDNNEIKYFAYHKEMKLQFYWTSAVPKHCKKNVIIRDLHRVKNLSLNFEQEVGIIGDEYIKARYPFCFINSVIDSFNQEKEDCLIPTSLFVERSSLPNTFWKQNGNEISSIIDNLEAFTNYKVKFRYFWKTRKVRYLFVLKDPAIH